MQKDNPLYKNQGIHVITALFTVEDGKFKVLLINRKNEPFKNKWILVGGACYNNENCLDAMNREMFEKTGLKNVELQFFNVFSEPERSPVMRMIAVAYIGVIDCKKVSILKETLKTNDAKWFSIDDVPELGYDHNEVLNSAIESLKTSIFDSSILQNLFPKYFTLPQLHKAYVTILDRFIDRRNFRKKLLKENVIVDTGKYEYVQGKKPAKLYRFNKSKNHNIII